MVVVAVVSDLSKPRSGAKAGFGGLIQFTNWVGGDPGAHASVIRVHTSVGALPKRPQNAQDYYQDQEGCSDGVDLPLPYRPCAFVFTQLMLVVVRRGMLV